MKHRLHFVLLSGLMLGLMTVASVRAQGSQPPLRTYLLIPVETGLEIRRLEPDGRMIPLTVLGDFTLEGRQAAPWNIVDWYTPSVSPDGRVLAFPATHSSGESALFLYDLSSGDLKQYALSFPADSLLALDWSPDGSAILLDAFVSLAADTHVFDVATGQLTQIIDGFNVGLKWLPDSIHFVYHGPSPCRDACQSDGDFYLGDRFGLNTRAITRIDAAELGLVDRMTSVRVGGSLSTWAPRENRLYINLNDLEIAPDSLELLYSVDLAGNLRFEADIAAVYPDSELPIELRRMFVHPDDGSLYLLTETQRVDDAILRWSILRYTPSSSPIEVVYERDFYEEERFISSLSISPDGRFVAFGGRDSSGGRAGILLVVDLLSGQAVLEQDDIKPICKLVWLDDQSLLYNQSDATNCFMLNLRQPADRLVWLNLADGSTGTIQSAPGAPLYFVSTESSYPWY